MAWLNPKYLKSHIILDIQGEACFDGDTFPLDQKCLLYDYKSNLQLGCRDMSHLFQCGKCTLFWIIAFLHYIVHTSHIYTVHKYDRISFVCICEFSRNVVQSCNSFCFKVLCDRH